MALYENDIIEEGSFLRWKEDVNDTYPGKGKALFQVQLVIFLIGDNCVKMSWYHYFGDLFGVCIYYIISPLQLFKE